MSGFASFFNKLLTQPAVTLTQLQIGLLRLFLTHLIGTAHNHIVLNSFKIELISREFGDGLYL